MKSSSSPTLLPATEILQEKGVSQYQRVASLLRHRIASGVYPDGTQLPTMPQLAAALGVSLITVRHACGLLAREGLILSQRGKGTFVSATPSGTPTAIRQAIDNPYHLSTEIAFDIIDVEHGLPLPEELREGEPGSPDFTRLRKRQLYAGEPFCYVEVYVLTSLFLTLPPSVVRQKKLMSYVLDHLSHPQDRLRVRTTVAPADHPLCEQLKVPLSSPVARMARRIVDRQGKVIYGGLAWYRWDKYTTEIDLSVEQLKQMPGMVEAKASVKRNRK